MECQLHRGRARLPLSRRPLRAPACHPIDGLGGRGRFRLGPNQPKLGFLSRLFGSQCGRAGVAVPFFAVVDGRKPGALFGSTASSGLLLAPGGLELLSDGGAAIGRDSKPLGLELQRLQPLDLLKHSLVAGLLVRDGGTRQGVVQVGESLPQPRLILSQGAGFLHLRLEMAQLGSVLGELALESHAPALHLVQPGRLLLELFDTLLVEVSVGDYLIDLPLQQSQDLLVFAAQGPVAGGTVAQRTGLDQALPLVLELLVQVQQGLPFRLRILCVADPRGAGRLDVECQRRECRSGVIGPGTGGQ